MTIDDWIEEFEENSELAGWSDIHKFVHAKKLLEGNAKKFVKNQKQLKTFSELKIALCEEFGKTCTSTELHHKLSNRTKQSNENCKDYYYAMQEFASSGYIEVESVMQHIIAGINDDEFNKTMLYKADTMTSLREKLKLYEKIKLKSTMKTQSSLSVKFSVQKPEPNSTNVKECLCYSCGEAGHSSKMCTSKHLGMRCFNCKQFGHVSKECKQPIIIQRN